MLATLTRLWLAGKRAASRRLAAGKARASLPEFKTIDEVAAYIERNLIYTHDALGGLADKYSHPEVVNHLVVHNLTQRQYGEVRYWPLKLDCDDIAVFGVAACRKLPGVNRAELLVVGYRGFWAAVGDLLYNVWNRDPNGLYFHETCLVTFEDGRRYLMDAGGLIDLGGSPKSTIEAASDAVSAIYGKDLVAAPVPYPFED